MGFLPAHTTKRHFQLNQPKAGSIGNESEERSRWRLYPTALRLGGVTSTLRAPFDREGFLRPEGVTTTVRASFNRVSFLRAEGVIMTLRASFDLEGQLYFTF